MLVYLQIALLIIITSLGFYLALFKSYFQEKGKNIATKEDIEEITTKVEKIKSDLNYLTQSKLSMQTEERDALIDYYTRYQIWLNLIMESSFGHIDENNESVLDTLLNEIFVAKFDFEMARAKLDILLESREIRDIESTILIETLELQQLTEKSVLEIKQVFINIRYLKARTSPPFSIIEYRDLLEKFSVIVREYFIERHSKYEKLLSGVMILRKCIYSRIRELISN